ncbi:hypothetical protein ABZU32_20600 [Sphaerisporangium sp. NPDC005288]|uniref:hypothetical protein n=1 Tax=Sphaerisporangium sp. NPDC005288 TaxID=3155114 RepID=UPI0033ADDAAB
MYSTFDGATTLTAALPRDGSTVGGWVVPRGEKLDHWQIAILHARYVAPPQTRPYLDGWRQQRHATIRNEMRAYHVDLAGRFTLPDLMGMLLFQVPPVRWWMLRPADPDSLRKYEKYLAP